MRPNRRFSSPLALAALLLCGVPAILLICLSPVLLRNVFSPSPRTGGVTAPLQPAVVQDICEKFEVPSDDPRCQPGAQVYAPDFSRTIQAGLPEGTTYQDVQARLGAYQVRCDAAAINAAGTTYFACDYDLQGDGSYSIQIQFLGSNPSDATVWRVAPKSGR